MSPIDRLIAPIDLATNSRLAQPVHALQTEMEVEIVPQHRAPKVELEPSAWRWHDLTGAAARPLRDPLLAVNFLLLAVGASCGPLLLRLYFLRGGARKWLSSLLQTAGWPLLLVPLCFSFSSRRRRRRHRQGGGDDPISGAVFLMTPRLLAATVVVGIMTGADNFLYAYGTAYLPVSTSSILISTQLAFTAAFALLLVRQRFTASTVNAIVLLSVGAALLGMGSGGDRPAGVTGAQYAAGFGTALGAAALYGLVLPVMELSQAWHAARAGAAALTYTLVVEIQVVIGLTATAFCAVGMLVNKDFQAIPGEARQSELGQAGYYLLLVGTAAVYQCFCLGIIGAIYYGSALLAGIIITVFLPMTEVLAVVFFHEPFSGTKGVALGLSLWGLASYFYGEVRHMAPDAEHQSSSCVDRDCEN
ncbi:purine permease 3-like [Hordeum vulgare subsp. vulgare]|uniref:Probable purine permease n=1 Tax=Hordeum vulgare subsp. vulgare TaxID=112509 RepID=A0A287SK30_HORVV|nr:purine permease 3-like [Hordeum vulgare subsp. vulgare]